jgi:hypothetical protein
MEFEGVRCDRFCRHSDKSRMNHTSHHSASIDRSF